MKRIIIFFMVFLLLSTDGLFSEEPQKDITKKRIHIIDIVESADFRPPEPEYRIVCCSGIDLDSEDLEFLLTGPANVKKLHINPNPKINDDSNIRKILEYQSNLDCIRFYGVPISDETMKSIANLKKLRQLELSCDYVSWKGLQALSESEMLQCSLEVLSLNCGRLYDEYLFFLPTDRKECVECGPLVSKFKNLRALNIEGRYYQRRSEEENFFPCLSKLQHLESLRILSHTCSDEDVEKYILPLKHLKVLSLCNHDILSDKPVVTDKTIAVFNQMKQLEYLDVTGTNITINGMWGLKDHPSLEWIWYNNKIGDQEALNVFKTEFRKYRRKHNKDIIFQKGACPAFMYPIFPKEDTVGVGAPVQSVSSDLKTPDSEPDSGVNPEK